ncbi:hypothetical protein HELRODRAFT_170992 [Helobdella robusta]|uniref:Uncharacterized protein n=1 Tax=Helobdella robusta TaxID=6412 RepID=T1F3N9_HELRO|nr:hypothetical protein HELRODRAFT_170992 [Helobdella robusta]ESO06956.1 hypothetical protein HELRODRAFT_170992 [Helobdella robusta]
MPTFADKKILFGNSFNNSNNNNNNDNNNNNNNNNNSDYNNDNQHYWFLQQHQQELFQRQQHETLKDIFSGSIKNQFRTFHKNSSSSSSSPSLFTSSSLTSSSTSSTVFSSSNNSNNTNNNNELTKKINFPFCGLNEWPVLAYPSLATSRHHFSLKEDSFFPDNSHNSSNNNRSIDRPTKRKHHQHEDASNHHLQQQQQRQKQPSSSSPIGGFYCSTSVIALTAYNASNKHNNISNNSHNINENHDDSSNKRLLQRNYQDIFANSSLMFKKSSHFTLEKDKNNHKKVKTNFMPRFPIVVVCLLGSNAHRANNRNYSTGHLWITKGLYLKNTPPEMGLKSSFILTQSTWKFGHLS